MIPRFVALAAGLYLMAAPAIWSYADEAIADSDRIVGPIAAAASLVAVWGIARSLRWVTLPSGLWLLVAPWVLGAPWEAAAGDVGAGVVMIVTAFLGGRSMDDYAGGWTSLARPLPGR